MTPSEILDGFRQLQAKHPGQKYRGADLNAVWPQLLGCSPRAFATAVGIMLKHSRRLPEADYVLAQTLKWEQGEELAPRAGLNPDTHAREALRLTRGRLDGTIDPQEYVAGLYQLSEISGCSEYAETARRAEAGMKSQPTGETHDC